MSSNLTHPQRACKFLPGLGVAKNLLTELGFIWNKMSIWIVCRTENTAKELITRYTWVWWQMSEEHIPWCAITDISKQIFYLFLKSIFWVKIKDDLQLCWLSLCWCLWYNYNLILFVSYKFNEITASVDTNTTESCIMLFIYWMLNNFSSN